MAPTSKDHHSYNKWNQTAEVLGKKIQFKIDTGARCNTMKLKDFQRLTQACDLTSSKRNLRSYSNYHIYPVGTSVLQLKCNSKTLNVQFEIINIDQENVLLVEAAEQLGLITRLATVTKTAKETPDSEDELKLFWSEFLEISKNSGTLPGDYSIKLNPGAKGVVHAPDVSQ